MRVFVAEDTTCVPTRSLRVGVASVYVCACYSDSSRACAESSKDVEIRQAIVDIIGPVGLCWSVFWDYILETPLSPLITRDCTTS